MVATVARACAELAPVRGSPSKERVNARVGTGGPALHAGRRMTSLLTDALVGARFLSVWLATGVLLLGAKIIAPAALESASWSFVLPYMTVLAVAALGQMLVIRHAGIDL